MTMRTALLAALLAALAACSREPSPSEAGGITAGEAKALDEAAEMVEAKRLPDDALRPPAVQAVTPGAVPSQAGH